MLADRRSRIRGVCLGAERIPLLQPDVAEAEVGRNHLGVECDGAGAVLDAAGACGAVLFGESDSRLCGGETVSFCHHDLSGHHCTALIEYNS